MPSKEELEKLIQDCMSKKGWTYEHCKKYIAGGIWGGQHPTIEEVHIPDQLKVEKKKKLFSIDAVPILKVGKWTDMYGNNVEFTIDDLDEIAKNTNALLKTNLVEPPLKLGHSENQKLAQEDGYPAIGYVARVYRLGNTLFADFVDIPEKIYNLIKNRAYSKVSAEVYTNLKHPDTNENIGKTLRAVALLGADLPAIKGLGDIEKIYNKEGEYQILNFSEKELGGNMQKWTLEDVKKMVPCCVDIIKKFMEEDKITELDTNKLAEYLTKIRIMKLQEEGIPKSDLERLYNHFGKEKADQMIKEMGLEKALAQLPKRGTGIKKEQETIECPAGYKWDDSKGECVPEKSDVKVEGHICPKGYKWDEEQNKCVPIEIIEEKEKKDKENEQETDKNVQDIDLKDKEKIKQIIKENEQAIKDFKLENDKRPPKGWWDECISAVSDITDTPEQLCGWIYHHHMSPERKQEIEATRQSENKQETKMSENLEMIKMRELQEKVKQLEKEKIKNMVNELKEKNRGILLPKFDEYIDKFVEKFSEKDEVVKFGEKEYSMLELFFKFIDEFAKSKPVIFSELAKENDAKLEERKSEIIASIEAQGYKPSNVELAILAEHIAKTEKISFDEALTKAYKKLSK
jgi:hypothetical protein